MAIVLDTTTRAEYLAQTLASARASLVVSALPAPVVCEVYDGLDVLRASGTMASPWATASGATVTVGEVTGQGIDVTSGGAPDSNWYCQFRSGSRFVRGTFGVLGSGRDFVWSLASFSTASRGTLGTVTCTAQGAVVVAPVNVVAPSISGSLTVGSVLTAVDGTWINSPTGYSYRWTRSATLGGAHADIAGATLSTYTLQPGDQTQYIGLRVTATNDAGAIAATAAAVGPIIAFTTPTLVAANELRVSLPTGSDTNYPFQFGRVFRQGEIANFPQVKLDGVAITTQADIKNRWPDGSVKMSVISVILPTIGTTERVLTFQNQASGNNTAITTTSMLADFDFDAQIVASNFGETGTQVMLGSNGNVTAVVAGGVVPTSGAAPNTWVQLTYGKVNMFNKGGWVWKPDPAAAGADREDTFSFVGSNGSNLTGTITVTSLQANREQTQTVSARTMLADLGANNAAREAVLSANAATFGPNSHYWTKGPICTTLILADHTSKAYDYGRIPVVRPVFEVQFWDRGASGKQYRVRFIGENSDLSNLSAQAYDLTLKVGHAAPATKYTKEGATFGIMSRWSRVAWSGTAPAQMNENHGVGFLAETRLIPNYDPSVVPSASKISALLASWATKEQFPGGLGLYDRTMGNVGGRAEIGIYPEWDIWALYSGQASLITAMRENTDLLCSFPMFMRNGSTGNFDDTSGVSGLGRIPTRDRHPAWSMNIGLFNLTGANEQRTLASGGAFHYFLKVPDNAHEPGSWALPYMTTGEHWYIECLQMYQAHGMFEVPAQSNNYTEQGGGRDPRDCHIRDQNGTRNCAWIIRDRARAAVFSPDGSVEKTYLTAKVESCLRGWEGRRIGTTTGDPIRDAWVAGRDSIYVSNPVHYWAQGGSFVPAAWTTVQLQTSGYWTSYLQITLGHLYELGFNAAELRAWVAEFYNARCNTPGISPSPIGEGTIATNPKSAPAQFYQSYADAYAGMSDATGYIGRNGSRTPFESAMAGFPAATTNNYAYEAAAALAMSYGLPGMAVAYDWCLTTGGLSAIDRGLNPQSAILPRV
jgi:hypothetical protein